MFSGTPLVYSQYSCSYSSDGELQIRSNNVSVPSCFGFFHTDYYIKCRKFSELNSQDERDYAYSVHGDSVLLNSRKHPGV